jgi:hypothetical protein
MDFKASFANAGSGASAVGSRRCDGPRLRFDLAAIGAHPDRQRIGGMSMLKLSLAALALAAAAPAEAAIVQAQSPQTIVTALQKAGYMAQLASDSGGDPMINSAASGSKFKVFFYNCTDNKDCTTIQFYVGYHLDKPVAVDEINGFNQSKRFIRAMIDKENDPVMVMDLNLDKGGMSDALFIDNLEVWTSQIADFERAIGFRK